MMSLFNWLLTHDYDTIDNVHDNNQLTVVMWLRDWCWSQQRWTGAQGRRWWEKDSVLGLWCVSSCRWWPCVCIRSCWVLWWYVVYGVKSLQNANSSRHLIQKNTQLDLAGNFHRSIGEGSVLLTIHGRGHCRQQHWTHWCRLQFALQLQSCWSDALYEVYG